MRSRVVQGPRPPSDGLNEEDEGANSFSVVDPNVVVRSACDCEWMPLLSRYGLVIDFYVLTRSVNKIGGAFDNKFYDILSIVLVCFTVAAG